jgi:hypothetical protein
MRTKQWVDTTGKQTMDKTSVLSKTGRGLLQIKHKSHQLAEAQFRVLKLIDGKATVDALASRVLMNDRDLQDALKALADRGFIRELIVPGRITDPRVGSDVPALENDLDFTQDIAKRR